MNIHEYQAKELFKKYNVPTLRGHIVFTPDEAVKAAQELGGNIWVVKAQIHAGGRGLGGGVKLARSKSVYRRGCRYQKRVLSWSLAGSCS